MVKIGRVQIKVLGNGGIGNNAIGFYGHILAFKLKVLIYGLKSMVQRWF